MFIVMKKITKQRSCVGCKKKSSKFDFWRVVFVDGKLVCDDKTQKLPGRGLYICPNVTCLETAIKRNAFNYRLKQKISREEVEKFRLEFISKNQIETGS